MQPEIVNLPVATTLIPEAAHKLAQRALLEHERAEKNVLKAVEHTVKAGQALLKAYDLCEYGHWEAFLEMHFGETTKRDDGSRPMSARTARTYMQIARNWSRLIAEHPEGFATRRLRKLAGSLRGVEAGGAEIAERIGALAADLLLDIGVCAGTAGEVYFIEAVGADRVKIGVSGDVGKRFAQLAGSFPGPLELLGRVAGGRAREASLHRRLANFHIGGEWFHLTPGVRAVIQAVIADEPE